MLLLLDNDKEDLKRGEDLKEFPWRMIFKLLLLFILLTVTFFAGRGSADKKIHLNEGVEVNDDPYIVADNVY
jgi:hypothetical protein